MKAHQQLDKWTADKINNVDDVKAFFADIVLHIGMGFNIDTHFGEYIGWDSDFLYTPEEIIRLQLTLEKCDSLCAGALDPVVDIYELALNAMGHEIQID